jgi:hypothetical protein
MFKPLSKHTCPAIPLSVLRSAALTSQHAPERDTRGLPRLPAAPSKHVRSQIDRIYAVEVTRYKLRQCQRGRDPDDDACDDELYAASENESEDRTRTGSDRRANGELATALAYRER